MRGAGVRIVFWGCRSSLETVSAGEQTSQTLGDVEITHFHPVRDQHVGGKENI